MRYRLFSVGVCFILLILCSTSLYAQEQNADEFSFEFRGAPLSVVLEDIAKKAEVDMIYDPAIVEGFNVYERIQNEAVPDILRGILADIPLDFITLSSGTIVIVEAVSEQPAYGSYFGKVIDRRTGKPLPGASVMLTDASGGTSTTESGTFALNKLVSGTYKIIFSYVGYEPVSKTITIEPDQEVREKVQLEPKPVSFAPIVVTGHVPQMPYQGGEGQSIDPNTEWETTGRMRDPIQSLTLFSGINSGLHLLDLHLQGGRQGEHRIMLDGVPVYNPHSFGQMFSAFSPYGISKVRLYKAGYDVSKGSQISGLVDLTHDVSNGDQNRLMVQGDPLSVNLRGDLHVPMKDSGDDSALDIMGAARFNYWNLFQEPILDRTLREWDDLDPLTTNLLIDSDSDASAFESREHQSDVQFYDVHLASRYKIDAYNTLTSSFYLGRNFVSTDLLKESQQGQSSEYLYARDEYRWNNVMGQITYNQLVSSRLDVSTQVSFSSNRLRHRYLIGTSDNPGIPGLEKEDHGAALDSFRESDEVPTQRNRNEIQHLILSSDATYSFTPDFNLEGGIQLDYVNSRVDLTDLFYLTTSSDQESMFFSSYLNAHWRAGEYWKFTAGNHLTFLTSPSKLYAEPRASIQFDQPESDIGYWSVRLAGGLYRQFINQFEMTNPGPTSLVPSLSVWSHARASETPKAWHLSGTFHLQPAENTTANLELFYKWQPTTYTVSYRNLLQGVGIDRSGFSAFAEPTEMKTFGGGVHVSQSFAQSKLEMMLGYDYSMARINLDTQFGRMLPAPWNKPHQLQFRTLWRISSGLTAVAKWKSIWGRAWGFRQAYYDFLSYRSQTNAGSFSFATPEDDMLSPFHQLDLSLVYEPSITFMDLRVRLELMNLLDRRNTLDWSLRPVQQGLLMRQYEKEKRTMPGFSPSVSIQVQLDSNRSEPGGY